MKFSTALSGALVAAASLVDAVSIPEIAAKRQTQTTVVTGVPGGQVLQRVELRTMQQKNPDLYSLYILGLRDFMSVDQSDPLSYYQIAGIHGRPYSPWEGWTSNAGPNGYGGGYCTHVSNIFLPWHRPYLALFEQQLYIHVQTVANRFTNNKAHWTSLAQTFRMPYWDWAAVPSCAGCQPYPLLVQNQFITITTPSGSQSVLNPLFRYDFHPISANDMVYSPFAQWGVTKRYPTSWDQNGVSQNNLIAPQIANNRASFADRLWNLFTNNAYKNFTMFSNEAWQASSGMSGADSIESVHDAIHSITGSNGHMTYLDYSAFDPIFWLHHTNIDRLWDMYNTINPNSYVTRAPSQGSTYTTQAGTQIDANSPLIPWAKDSRRSPYTSNDVKSTTRFGYSYPETQGKSSDDVKRSVNQLYGSSNQQTKRHTKRDDGHHYHYIANIVSQKFQMKGSYAVYMFLGDAGSDASKWPISPNLVGTHGVSANLADDQNAGMSNMDLPITGTIPLTTTLLGKVKSGELPDMTPKNVEAYLKSKLTWHVAMLDGTVVPATKVPGFSVTVVTSDVKPPPSDTEFATWGTFASMANATFGKDGGHDDAWWSGELTWSLSELISKGLSTSRNRN